VFFVEEPVFVDGAAQLEIKPVGSSLFNVIPHLPKGLSPAEVELRQRRMLEDLLKQEKVTTPLLWYYTPMALGFSRHLEPSLVVYDCMDELSAFRGAPPELRRRERELFMRADLVFTGGQSLYEAKRTLHPSVHAFPSSVEHEHFARARDASLEAPEDQRGLSGPVVGFYGVLDERLDTELVARLADARPDIQVVLVGPVVKIDPAHLPRRPNLHYLGQKTYEELPRYLAGWDVALLPFALNEATRFISPTKTLEYLAAGKPVVSTPIRDVTRPYGELGLVRIGSGEAFIDAVSDALAERGTPQELERQKAADARLAATSWDRTWRAMDALIEDATSGRRVA
jgi:UDP-galactopyranose mutase